MSSIEERLKAMTDAELKLYSDECDFGCGNVQHVPAIRAELAERGIFNPHADR